MFVDMDMGGIRKCRDMKKICTLGLTTVEAYWQVYVIGVNREGLYARRRG